MFKVFLVSVLFTTTIFCQQSSPNILLIIADDMGIDSTPGFQIQSENMPVTPTLNTLRQNGVAYSNCWAAPQCSPTRASIMSGKYGIKTGVMRPPLILDTSHTSLFTKIATQSPTDYSMALIGKWHIGGNDSNNYNHPADSGVPYYEGVFTSQVDDYYNWTKVNNEGNTEQIEEYATTHFTNQAIGWVANQTKPWFLWLAHVAPHAPFQTPPEGTYTTVPTNNRTTYLAMIESLDYETARLLESMDAETLENTVVIFIGDNGTPGATNTYYPNGHAKSSIYEGGIRVPMIISGKSVERVNQVEEGLVHAADLHATILELAGVQLPGGDFNSLSIKPSLSFENQISREINYTDYETGGMNGVQSWVTRTNTYKLIQDANGNQEFYNIANDLKEENNLINTLTTEQEDVKIRLEEEASIIRNDWSCSDGIKNGNEQFIDDCNNTCTVVDVLGGDIPSECCEEIALDNTPSIYFESVEGNKRIVYSNNYPNHDYCFASTRFPTPYYRIYEFDLNPQLSGEITSLSRANGRPANYFGIGLNGVYMMPAPATPFIFENVNTGEYNWDWVFEPTTNIGDEQDLVTLDCASAHVNPNSGYHYHGNMVSYVESLVAGIATTSTIPQELLQVGWASDGFPILYRFGPDKEGNIKEMFPSFQLKAGLRPGDGISAPCGSYTGKYTNDFEYIPGKGDLDECNGVEASVTLTTAQGEETFEYYYVVTHSFPQISRCMKGNFSDDFISNLGGIENPIDADEDGFVSIYDCNDNDASIHPLAVDNPTTSFDESCGGTLSTISATLEQAGFYIKSNPNDGNFTVIATDTQVYQANLYTMSGQLIKKEKGKGLVEFKNIENSGIYLLTITRGNSVIGTTKIIVE